MSLTRRASPTSVFGYTMNFHSPAIHHQALRATILILAASATASAQQIALYDAGVAGNPATAPDPTSVGWTLHYPSGSNVAMTDVSPDGTTGLNAWSIDDTGVNTGDRAHYELLFTPQQNTAAFNLGWEYEVNMRMISSAGVDALAEYAAGTGGSDNRYLAFYEVSGNDVLCNIFAVGIVITCPNAMDGNYHSFMIRKPAGQIDAEFYYDGALLGPFPAGGSNPGAPSGGVTFGTGSSAGQANVNFNYAEFRILSDAGNPICFGDGNGTACPCGNDDPGGSGGCSNSSTTGALLASSGTSSLAAGDLVLSAANAIPGQPGLFFQGDNSISGGSGVIFGDGLRCCGSNVVRLQVVVPDGSGSASSTVNIAASSGASAGDTRCYQYWYRDPSAGPCGSGFNLTNAIELTWAP